MVLILLSRHTLRDRPAPRETKSLVSAIGTGPRIGRTIIRAETRSGPVLKAIGDAITEGAPRLRHILLSWQIAELRHDRYFYPRRWRCGRQWRDQSRVAGHSDNLRDRRRSRERRRNGDQQSEWDGAMSHSSHVVTIPHHIKCQRRTM
jgi:hypothetical protein